MRRAQSLVVNQLVFLVLPDGALHVKRRLGLRRRPAIAPALDVMRVMKIENLIPLRRNLDAEQSYIFRRVEVPVERRIDLFLRFFPVTHFSLLFLPFYFL